MTAATAAHTLADTLAGLMSALSGFAVDGDARIVVTARTRCGSGQTLQHLSVGPRKVLDAALTQLVCGDWSAHASIAVRDSTGTQLRRLHALAATWIVRPVLTPGAAPAVPTDDIAAALARLAAFPVKPAMVIVGGQPIAGNGLSVTGLYRLREPLDVRDAAGQARALLVLAQLATALGASTPPLVLADLTVPVPGTVVRDLQRHQLIAECVIFDPSRVSTLAQIEAAILKESV